MAVPFRRLIVLFVAAMWLTATHHCGLEAAEIWEAHAPVQQTCCEGGETHCTHDGCESVEERGFNQTSVAKVSPPILTLCTWIVSSVSDVPVFELLPIAAAHEFDHPLNWVPAWQFTRRAAPSPRAPAVG